MRGILANLTPAGGQQAAPRPDEDRPGSVRLSLTMDDMI
jgi:hypothetical protein